MLLSMRFLFPNKPVRTYDPHKTGALCGEGWIAQIKWNGKRVMVAVEDNKVTLSSREGRQWPTGSWTWLASLPIPQPWFADGELLHQDSGIVLWDLAVVGGEFIFHTEYYPRLQMLQDYVPQGIGTRGKLSVVQTFEGSEYKRLLDMKDTNPHMEGFVWKRKNATDLWGPNTTRDVGSQVKYRW